MQNREMLDSNGLFHLVEKGITRINGWSLQLDTFKLIMRQFFNCSGD